MSASDGPDPIRELETSLGLPENFYDDLYKEDDWSFIIKIHALVEAAVTHLLSETTAISYRKFIDDGLNKQSLADAFSMLELSDKRRGKVVFGKSLGLLMDYQRAFIHSLSEVRNAYVHDVKKVVMTLTEYLDDLSESKQNQFIDSFGIGIPDDVLKSTDKKVARRDVVRKNPKLSIWLSGIICLREIYYCINSFSLTEKSIEMTEEMAKLAQQLAPIFQNIISKQVSGKE